MRLAKKTASLPEMRKVRVGTSGWTYRHWRGRFYPVGLSHKRELEYASRRFATIEINGSFYALQRPKSYLAWYAQVPKDFVFAVKANRYITHIKRLKDPEKALANFFASGVLALAEKLGPILWQLPPQMRFDPIVMENFLRLLPKNFHEATKLARKHEARMEGRTFVPAAGARPIRHAIEVRHESFLNEEFYSLLKKHNAALVAAHSGGRWPQAARLTADFAYVRFHGSAELVKSGYRAKPLLNDWSKLLSGWRRLRDVYAYFNNDAFGNAAFDAIELQERIQTKKQSG
jgi:uncharacterized protein YecE (DUF72 family)